MDEQQPTSVNFDSRSLLHHTSFSGFLLRHQLQFSSQTFYFFLPQQCRILSTSPPGKLQQHCPAHLSFLCPHFAIEGLFVTFATATISCRISSIACRSRDQTSGCWNIAEHCRPYSGLCGRPEYGNGKVYPAASSSISPPLSSSDGSELETALFLPPRSP